MNQPEVIIISALAERNRVIGKDGKLPWSIPEDSARFQRLTRNHVVVMGRKTWEFDVEKRPLSHRCNIIVSRSSQRLTPSEQLHYPFELFFANSLRGALDTVQDRQKVFIAGGAGLYHEALEFADTLELTMVEGDYEGDTFFPDYAHLIGRDFELVRQELHSGYRYETYRRVLAKVANSRLDATRPLQKVA
jgi:dihydrofolate reductase